MAASHGDLRHLLPGNYKRQIADWLEEDCPSLDYGGFVVGESEGEARLLGKSAGIIAGIPFFDEVFSQLGCTYVDLISQSPISLTPSGLTSPSRTEWHIQEGQPIPPNTKTHCATVRGPIRQILLGERVALNILARCSGIASKSASTLAALRAAGWNGILAGTRKTTPGFRVVEKYGILVGGADPHRHDLSHMTMLKDNHVWACANNGAGMGGRTNPDSIAAAIPKAVRAAKAAGGFATKVEVEVRSLEEADAAIEAGADVVMLDNFTAQGVREAARALKEKWKASGRSFLIEVSGGLTEESAPTYACPEVDILSTSSIHQGTGIVDFSLKVSLR
ncbi:Nicotinate-nucleotide pyrophosphorylase [Penicillium diatomitis]|uniref:Nicotinate-nucleotide pyrophosphorylase [carboxylating] n=1 Tax=Penicillium diatomitis TaxID=2819901 RepID=A0A9W9WL49_9EURO|nr:Nicotinate-nucleotide pyrophosphorylase [Penicillium diatomitis]KAJ5469480.1 Nicotinate-nucleotide pyrophosphorylase [Penicillium diatomitis]